MSTSSSFIDLHLQLAIRLACRFAPLETGFIERFADDLCWNDISANPSLNWTDEFLRRHVVRWRPVNLLRNPGITWTSPLIAAYGKRVDWHPLSQNPNLPIDEEFLERHGSDVVWLFVAEKNRHLTPQLKKKYGERLEALPKGPAPATLKDLFRYGEGPEALDLARPAASLTAAEARSHWDDLLWSELSQSKQANWDEDWLDLIFEYSDDLLNWEENDAVRELFSRRFSPLMQPNVQSALEARFAASPFVAARVQTHDDFGLIPGLDRKDDIDALFACPPNERPTSVEFTLSRYKEGPVRALGATEARTFHPTLVVHRRAREIIELFHLPEHFWLDVTVSDRKWPGDHVMLCMTTDVLDSVDFALSPPTAVLTEMGWAEGPCVNGRQELGKLAQAHAEYRDILDFSPAARLAHHRLQEPFDAIAHENDVLMSQRLLQALRDSGVTGLRAKSTAHLRIELPGERPPVDVASITPPEASAEDDDPRSPAYRFFEEKMERLKSAPSALPDSYKPLKDALGQAEYRLGRVFPPSFREFFSEHQRKTLSGRYRMLAASKFYLIGAEGYEISYPEVWGGVVFAEEGCGDALALLLTKRSDSKLGATVYELQHEAGVIKKRSLRSLLSR